MLDLRLFRNRTFLGATVIVATLAGGSFGVFVYLSLFLLDVAGGSPVEVGLWLAPLAIAAFVTSLGAGRLAGRVPLTGALALGMGADRGRAAADDRRRRGLVVAAPARRASWSSARAPGSPTRS